MPADNQPSAGFTKRYLDPVYLQLPLATREGLAGYIEHRYRCGHFLTAVLSNDLREAVNRADTDNLVALGAIVQWLFWNAPSECWGDKDKVRRWLTREED